MTNEQNAQRQNTGKFNWVRRLMNRTNGRHTGTHNHSEGHHDARYNTEPKYEDEEMYDQSGTTHTDRSSSLLSKNDNLSGNSATQPNGAASGNRVQILEQNNTTRHSNNGSAVEGEEGEEQEQDAEEDESLMKEDNAQRRSNSNFTIPSVSRTSITTASPSIQSDTASTNTTPTTHLTATTGTPSIATTGNPQDNASVITIASSSKHQNRRNSFDTNASTMAIAPESLFQRNDSSDSLPVSKSVTSSSRQRSVNMSLDGGETGSVKSQDILSVTEN